MAGELGMEYRFVIRRILFRLLELTCFPFVFLRVVGGIEHKAMAVQVRVGNTVNGACGKMGELAIGNVAGKAVFVFAFFTNPCLHPGFYFRHGFADGSLKRIEDDLFIGFASQRIGKANRLAGVEGEIIPYGSVGVLSPGQRFGGEGVAVIAQRSKIPFDNIPGQP